LRVHVQHIDVLPWQEEKGKGKEKEAADERAKKKAEEYEKGLQTVLQTLYESLAATLFMDTSIAALTRIFNVRRFHRKRPYP
jgi:FtsH-binding integral membrane protein